MFRRVLVANRGEIARRIIRTLTKMGVESVAVFSEADKNLGYLQEATKAICIGPAQAKDSYLLQDAILEAALITDCEALHPGFGFLSENARFATRCQQQKLTFIGPSAEHITIMGDKAQAIKTMASINIPTLPGSNGVVNYENALEFGKKFGYPILLKARAGGGGKGMRLVDHEADLKQAFVEAQLEAHNAFFDQELYVEKYIKNARHIEFQVLGDLYGNVICLGERECSIQRKHQKLLEEAPANKFPAPLRKDMSETIIAAMKKLGYFSAGTLEFLLSPDQNLYFMEMNTRIQVEHPVTELIYGVDIVEWQVRIACGEKLTLKQEELKPTGAAIECRINAEDAKTQFSPSPGTINALTLPPHTILGPIRIDTHIDKGSVISPYYDSMVAKIIAHGSSRTDALEKLKTALGNFTIDGITTTIDFHKAILNNKEFVEGNYDCSFISRYQQSLLKNLK